MRRSFQTSEFEDETDPSPRGMRSNFPHAICALVLDVQSPVPIYQQISSAVRSAIHRGDLPAGTLLPTSREIGLALGVGRNTVVAAFTRLVAEGYLVSNTRRGTRVASHQTGTTLLEMELEGTDLGANSQTVCSAIEISYAARRVLEMPAGKPTLSRNFAANEPDPSLYPRNKLSRLLTEEFCRPPGRDTQNGFLRFQTVLASYLRRMRGVQCEPSQIVPVTGLESALDLTARLVIDPAHTVLVEDPAPAIVRHIFAAAGARLEVLPSDRDGAAPNRASGAPPRLIYVAPSMGMPLGRQLSEPRRSAVLDLARRTGAVLFEADTNWELTYDGTRLLPLQRSDIGPQILYFGSMYETLGPQIRVGYMVVPHALVTPFMRMSEYAAQCPDTYVLAALAAFIEDSHYQLHLRAIRTTYSQRVRRACEALRAQLNGCEVVEPCGGFHATVLVPRGVDEHAACRAAAASGLVVSPLSSFFMNPGETSGLVIGLGTVPDRSIDVMVKQLADAISQANVLDRPLEVGS